MSKLPSPRARKLNQAPSALSRPVQPSFKQRIFALLILALTLLYTQQQRIFHNALVVLEAHIDTMQPRVQKITVLGNENISYTQIVKLSTVNIGDHLLQLDLSSIQKQLQSNGWIKTADIRRNIAGTLQITIHERVPQVAWAYMGKVYLLDRHGDKIEMIPPEQAHGLLKLYGKGADIDFIYIINALHAIDLGHEVVELVKINERRWNVILQNGLEIKLPSDDFETALLSLPSVMTLHSEVHPLSYIDLRAAPNKIYIKYQNAIK